MRYHCCVRTLSLLAACLFATGTHAGDDDNLFGDDLPKAKSTGQRAGQGIKGYVQFEAARTIATPDHWSKLRSRAELGSTGKLGDSLKWKLGARVDYDFVYGVDDFYPSDVERNQRFNAELRENYLDYSLGNWDFRLGKQHVVWGEMVGLFFADVVSARDMREFILPEFDAMRITQWALRAEYFNNDLHAELLWIPVPSYDNIGRPGAAFYPAQPVPAGFNARYLPEQFPEHNGADMNYGLRLSALKFGWDVSAFYYRSSDIAPTFYRQFTAPNSLTYQARHDRIHQAGATLSKDFGDVVLKAEAVYTQGRSFATLNLADSDGVVRQNTMDWATGLDFTLPAETRFNVQFFQRYFASHDPYAIADRREDGYSLLLNNKFFANWEGQLLFLSSLNRTDWLFRPRLTWNFERNWRWVLGADIFHGPQLGLFGRYTDQDRVYSEVRYSF